MREILTPDEMRFLEKSAFDSGVSPLLLMEDAAREMTRVVLSILPKDMRCGCVLCGSGNNGGDGLAMARLLTREGCRMTVYMPEPPKTAQAEENLRYLRALGVPVKSEIPTEGFSFDFAVDALFGTGFHGAVKSPYDQWIQAVNESRIRYVFSVDIPSGLDGLTGITEGGADTPASCVHATHTLVLGYPKQGIISGRDRAVCGTVIHCPIQLPAQSIKTDTYLLEPRDIRLIPERSRDIHKGNAGRVLFYAGSTGMAGAAAMAALAALRMGAGLVTAACPKDLIPILQTAVPNAMCLPAEQLEEQPPAHDVLAAGCGLGIKDNRTRSVLIRILSREQGPVILDADALNILASDPFPLPENTLLTPHVGEAARLLGTDVNEIMADLKSSAVRLAQKYSAHVLLKSSVSVATDGRKCWVNSLRAPALAKGGSGDALCGMIAALCAEQQALLFSRPLYQTAAVASLLLSLCGQSAEQIIASRSALTGDILDRIPFIFLSFGKEDPEAKEVENGSTLN